MVFDIVMPNSDNSIDVNLLQKIRDEVADLKEALDKIEEEFSRKGETKGESLCMWLWPIFFRGKGMVSQNVTFQS